jgi:flagellar hook protein FlgE
MQVVSNLNASSDVGTVFNAPVTVYDSLGTTHNLNIAFTKTDANAWSYSITIPAADLSNGGNTVLATGNMSFNGNGVLASPSANVSFSVDGLADKASPMSVSWQLLDSSGNPVITQSASTSATSGTTQDGYASGTLQSFSVDSSGVIQGVFSNGKNMAIGQVALATFADLQGLQRAGDNSYFATMSSGTAVVGAPNSGGRGTITGGALELSNVDVATEFSDLIIAQRGYEANAKVVTTMNTITQDTINLIQQ